MADFDQVARDYEAICNASIEFSGESSEFFAAQKVSVLARFWDEERLPRAGAFLDLGCGTGRTARLLREKLPDVRYTGIDPSSESIRVARERAPEGAHFLPFDGRSLPLPDASCDVVFAACVLHHVPPASRAALYAEIGRVLKPTGWFFVFEHNPWNPLTQYVVRSCEFDDDAVLLDANELARGLRLAGFERQRRGWVLFLPRSLRAAFPALEGRLERLRLGAQYWTAARRSSS